MVRLLACGCLVDELTPGLDPWETVCDQDEGCPPGGWVEIICPNHGRDLLGRSHPALPQCIEEFTYKTYQLGGEMSCPRCGAPSTWRRAY